MSASIALFGLAAFFEVAGCFAFWSWARRGGGSLVVLLGIASLIAFAFVLTRVDCAFAGPRLRGVWRHLHRRLTAVVVGGRGQLPTRADLIGAALAVVGALVIIGFAERRPGP